MFDPESLMFQTDWKPLTDWFRRRAEEAVARGEISNIYQHTETVNVPEAIGSEISDLAYRLGYETGRSIANLLDTKGVDRWLS
jgi:hypothetical protein